MAATVTETPSIIRPAEFALVYDIATLINAVYQQNIEPTQAGRVPKRIANKLRPQLKGQERLNYDEVDDYLDMLFVIMTDMGIARAVKPAFTDMKIRLEAGSTLAQWGTLDLIEQASQLLKQWQKNLHWIDIVGLDYESWSWSSSSYSSYSYYSRDTLKGRSTLLKYLRPCTAGSWYDIESLIEQIWLEDTLSLRHIPNYTSKSDIKKLQIKHEEWRKIDGEVYIGMFDSSLHDLGLLELGYTADRKQGNNPIAFMLTELGARLLAEDEEPEIKLPGQPAPGELQRTLIVQPNFELLLLQPDLPTLYSLLAFTQVSQIGIASSLKLNSAALLRALSVGIKIEQIVETLQQHSQKEVPQNVIYTLQDWAKQYKEAHVTPVLLIEVPNDASAQQICALAKLQQYQVRQIAPATLVINADINLQELKNTLDKTGVVTRISNNVSQR